jgi:hypothetical protein
MSLRAEFLRLGLRWFVKRKVGPATAVEALRRQDAFLELLVPPPPKGTQATHVDLDGVKAAGSIIDGPGKKGRLRVDQPHDDWMDASEPLRRKENQISRARFLSL